MTSLGNVAVSGGDMKSHHPIFKHTLNGVVKKTAAFLVLVISCSRTWAYKVLTDNDHFQVQRDCEMACFASAETKVEAQVGETVDFLCRSDREFREVRKLWTTDGGRYVADSSESFMDRYTILDEGTTLRLSPVTATDNNTTLWCNLLVKDDNDNDNNDDDEARKWRPRRSLRHFLYVGEGSMVITPQDFMNLDIRDSGILYHHRKVEELDSEQKTGQLQVSNVSVENIFFNGTMEKDVFHQDTEENPDGAGGGNVKEEKQYLDLGEKFKKTIKDDLRHHQLDDQVPSSSRSSVSMKTQHHVELYDNNSGTKVQIFFSTTGLGLEGSTIFNWLCSLKWFKWLVGVVSSEVIIMSVYTIGFGLD